ncbi:uncharacterized protein LOC112576203 isoform X2 [Pomacea canaliculata]|uniref:uncharacterized protein LOC112576203 isoform X2 n=1 Tax=Pomacea canaliculata TaxID=400727 RepID=UPI000D736E91|nr:uncharacterized protein LOC112576203 isoform X2 [Pomacea canaliculata]
MTAEAQAFWLQWVEDAFPELDSRAYFLPPVYFNRVPMTRHPTAGQNIFVFQSAIGQAGQINRHKVNPSASGRPSIPQLPLIHDSDIRDDAAMQRVLVCVQKMAEQNGEVLVGMTQLQFGQYLGEPCYAAAAAQLPLPANLPPALPRNWKRGDFDVLLIHRQYGLVVCEVKACGDNVKALNMSQEVTNETIRKKVKQAVTQLDKAEAMLSHLVSDIASGLRITRTFAFPNLTAHQLQQAVSGDTHLTQALCRCLGTADPADITDLCLFSDHLSDSKTPWDVSSHVLMELGNWWQRRVAGDGADILMTSALFCGPATSVTVPCTSPPRLSLKTLHQAVSLTGECYSTLITLFPEQVDLLNTGPPRLFLSGPPGTGKSVLLLLKGRQWLRCGHVVMIVSTGRWSRAVCCMLYHLLKTEEVTPGQLWLLQYDFTREDDVLQAVSDLLQAVKEGSLYIIADEAGYKGSSEKVFPAVFEAKLGQVPRLHLWAANCYHKNIPPGWQVEYLTRPLRFPPAVVREVEQDNEITGDRTVHEYSERGVPDHTDGPPVKRLYHEGDGHSGESPNECVACGREVGSFLHSLCIGVPVKAQTSSTTVIPNGGDATPPGLQWRDVLVLSLDDPSAYSGMVTGLISAGIPVQVMTDDDTEDVAMARSDVVWAAGGDRVRGLERKVVVCLQTGGGSVRLLNMSRCTSQLVIVFPNGTSSAVCTR